MWRRREEDGGARSRGRARSRDSLAWWKVKCKYDDVKKRVGAVSTSLSVRAESLFVLYTQLFQHLTQHVPEMCDDATLAAKHKDVRQDSPHFPSFT